MKKVLIVAENLDLGGVEKILISWLHALVGRNDLEVNLFLLNQNGRLVKEIDKKVKIVHHDKKYDDKFTPFYIRKKQKNKIKFLIETASDLIKTKTTKQKYGISAGAAIRYYYAKKTEPLKGAFDISIAFTDGAPLEYIENNVESREKIVFIHGEYNSKLPKIKQESFEKIDRIICVSERVKDRLVKQLPSIRRKTTVIDNFVKINKKARNERAKYPYDSPINILSVGRISPQKNYYNFIKKIIENKNKIQNKCHIYVIGEGPDYKKIETVIEQNKANNIVTLLGYKYNPYPWINACDIYVQPSINEGDSIAIKEAKAFNKPIIATDVGNANKVISDGHDGFIVKNLDDLIDKLVTVVNDKNIRNDIITNSKREAKGDDIYKKTLELIPIKKSQSKNE